MDNRKTISEVRNSYIDDDNYCHIDCYFSEDENEPGVTVAVVDMDSGKVFFIDNTFRSDKQVVCAIAEAILILQEKRTVRLTFTSEEAATAAEGVIGRAHDGTDNDQSPEFWDFEQIDLLKNLPDLVRFLGTCQQGSYYLSTEEW